MHPGYQESGFDHEFQTSYSINNPLEITPLLLSPHHYKDEYEHEDDLSQRVQILQYLIYKETIPDKNNHIGIEYSLADQHWKLNNCSLEATYVAADSRDHTECHCIL